MNPFRWPAALALVLLSLWSVQLNAAVYEFQGVFNNCLGTCNSFASLGGPSYPPPAAPSDNPEPSIVSGTIIIDVEPGGTFETADIGIFDFEVFNPASPVVAFDGTNGTQANPLPLNNDVAFVISGDIDFIAGTTEFPSGVDSSGALSSGQLTVKFTVPPFSSNSAIVRFNLDTGVENGLLFDGAIEFMNINGGFTLQTPTAIASPNPATFVDTGIGETSTVDITVSNTVLAGGAELVVSAIDDGSLPSQFAIQAEDCTLGPVAGESDCTVTVAFTPDDDSTVEGTFNIVSNDSASPLSVTVSGTGLAPNIVVTPASVTFADVVVGGGASRNVVITNDGEANLFISAVAMSNAVEAPFSIASNNCISATIAPNSESCTVTIDFDPTTEDTFTDSFEIVSSDLVESEITVNISGESVINTSAEIEVDERGPVDFGNITILDTPSQVFVVTNSGTADLDIGSIDLDGDSDFSIVDDSCSDSTIIAGTEDSCSFALLLEPLSDGDKATTVTVNSNAISEPTIEIMASASVFDGARIELDAATIEFGSTMDPVSFGETVSETLTISSVGTQPLDITAVVLSGVTGFTMDADVCAMELIPVGDTCEIAFTFSPTTESNLDRSAMLTIVSNAAENPTIELNLTGFVLMGSRIEPEQDSIVVSDADSAIFVDETSDFDIDLTNNGTSDLVISSVTIEDDVVTASSNKASTADDFEIVDDGCTGTVSIGDSCTIMMRFNPNGTGERTANLVVMSDSVDGMLMIPISAFAKVRPVEPPPEPGSQTVEPPAFATNDIGSPGSCFIATAAYGTYMEPEVMVLREFRDNVLLTNVAGRLFVDTYYSVSPPLADFIAERAWLRGVTRVALAPLVYGLKYPLAALLVLCSLWLVYRRRRSAKFELAV